MKDRSTLPNRVAEAFRTPDASSFVARPLRKSAIVATEVRCDYRNFGRTASMPREDAYLVALQFRACPDHDLYFDGRYVKPRNYRAGVTSIYDLRTDPVAELRDPYHSIMLHLSLKTLDDVAAEAGSGWVRELRHKPGVSVEDAVVRHLLSVLLPATAKPEEAHPLFLDHLALALTTHLACKYGEMRTAIGLPRGGLAAWQVRRAKELMSMVKEDVSLGRLAGECGLSVRHFTRAFRESTGCTPHRWLQRYRVECAQELLRKPGWSLSAIALSCGFADQSHFTRVFTAAMGVSPGAWRRGQGVKTLER